MPADRSAGGLPANTVEILTEVSGIAAAPAGLAERADALLAQVQRVVPFEAGMIALLPSGQRSYRALSRHGYDDHANEYYDGPEFLHDVELAGLQRSPLARRMVDLPMPPAEIRLWREYLLPAGFHEGFGIGLFTPDRRYTGLLGAATERATPPDPDAINLIGLLAPQIANAVDPWRSLSTIAGMVHAAIAGVVLAPSGALLPLPGLPDHRLLVVGSGVLEAAAEQLAHGGPHASFLAPLPGGDGTQTHARITVLATPSELQAFARAVILVSPAGEMHGLSGRELEVLGLLVTGASNERIAGTLGITGRTVEAHVDHLRAKLDAPSRTAAAARALRLGLFVPCPPNVRPGAPSSPADPPGRPTS
ncbi:MAG: DNA-binding transcriptional regulator, CsgD family [Modestobacter sp.]|nr:DNA-binding transcriptional regulator, CsgD family [Modestobacter sp.]